MTRPPYDDQFIPIVPHQKVDAKDARPMNCNGVRRDPRVTKGKNYNLTVMGSDCCESDGCC